MPKVRVVLYHKDESDLQFEASSPLEILDKIINWKGYESWNGYSNFFVFNPTIGWVVGSIPITSDLKHENNIILDKSKIKDPEYMEMKVMEIWEICLNKVKE